MNRFVVRRARHALALVACLLTASTFAQISAPTLRPPHQVTPDAALLPDYLALALSRTGLVDDPAARPLRLALAPPRPDPALIVLPVQTQAYGFSPMLRALLGARLDDELQRRHIDASNQTEIVDWLGPFVRRTDEATVATLAAAHARSALLALYVGHDDEGHAFLTLSRTDAGKARLAHRRLDVPATMPAAVDAFAAALPALLAELGLGDARPAPARTAGRRSGCEASDWNFDDGAASEGPAAEACHALIIGTLIPDVLTLVAKDTRPSAPDRLAWLARAWVESDALAARLPAMRSVAALAAIQLQFGDTKANVAALLGDRDVVVGPLARTISVYERSLATPARSRNEAAARLAGQAEAGLPAFAAAVVHERALYAQDFRTTDLCAMQLAVPHLKVPAGCEDSPIALKRPLGTASHSQLQLLDDWRLGAAWSVLWVEGEQRGRPPVVAEALRGMPPAIAGHPLVREILFATEDRAPHADGVDAHLAQSRARLLDYAQALATLQRDDYLQLGNRKRETSLLVGAERGDPALVKVADDLNRLHAATAYDDNEDSGWQPHHAPAPPATILSDGPFFKAEAARRAAAQDASPASAVPRDVPALPRTTPAVFGVPHMTTRPAFEMDPWPPTPPRSSLEARLAHSASDMTSRVALALDMLEHGSTVAEARRLIDARPPRSQAEDDITNGSEWALAGHMFFFAGELDAAREYYTRAASYRTDSENEMMARVRLFDMAGHPTAALAESARRRQRYNNEFSAADEAGYLFMLGRRDDAWRLLLPAMQTSQETPMWRVALAGHRIAGDRLEVLPDWIRQNKLESAKHDSQPVAPMWLRRYAILDRLPTRSDAALLFVGRYNFDGGLIVTKAAIDGAPVDKPYTLDDDIQFAVGPDNLLLMPLWAWAQWQASAGKDPLLQQFRTQSPDAGFSPTLARAVVLAADGQKVEALKSFAAARYKLGRLGTANAFKDDFRSGAYDFVLASWLVARKTGDPAYAQQALAIAVAYQHVVGYMGWPYAAEALLGHDPKARLVAACRAQKLDAGSMFLHESGLHPDPKSAVCTKATAW